MNPIKSIRRYLDEAEERELLRLTAKRKALQVKAKLAYARKRERDLIIEAKAQIKSCRQGIFSKKDADMAKKLFKHLG